VGRRLGGGRRLAERIVSGSRARRRPKSPCPILGGRASQRADRQSGSDGASPSRNHATSFRPSPPAERSTR
jgi:hypothetical protein